MISENGFIVETRSSRKIWPTYSVLFMFQSSCFNMVEMDCFLFRRRTVVCVLLVVFYPLVSGKLNLWITRDSLKSSLRLDLESSFYLIKDGQTASLLKNPQAFHDFVAPLAPTVEEIKLTWRSHPLTISYEMMFSSADIDVVPTPTISIPKTGKMSLYDQEFTIRFPCSGKKAGIVDIRMALNYSTQTSSGTRSANFTAFVRRKCLVKGTDKSGAGGKSNIYRVEESPKKKFSRGVIVALAAGLTVTICIAACIGIYIYYQKRNRKLQMKFDTDYELASKRKLKQYGQQHNQKDLVEDLYAEENDEPPRPIFKPKNKHCHRKWKKSSRHRRNLHIPLGGTPPPAYTPNASSPMSPGSLARILENIPEEQEEQREDENMCEDDEKKPMLSNKEHIVDIPETHLVENASFMLQCEVKEEKPSTKRITVSLLSRDVEDTGHRRQGANLQNPEDLYSVLNEHWAEKFKDCILPSDQVIVDSHPLGKGAFGRVHKGKARGISKDNPEKTYAVAVKVLRDAPDFDTVSSFVSEGLIMKDFNHPNVLNLLGVVLQTNSPPMLLMPFMKYGDLNQFLRNARATPRKPQSLSTRQLIHFGFQISRGMDYLSSLQYVHRDLATRNCMVGEDLTIRIADFGLATNVIQEDSSRSVRRVRLPMKWMPLESLTNYIFTEKSDVWSFGVVLWELMTLGKQPYLGIDNQEMENHLQKGNRLSQPKNCPDEIYQIMCSCWREEPLDRPTFSELTSRLLTFESKYKRYTLDYTLPTIHSPT